MTSKPSSTESSPVITSTAEALQEIVDGRADLDKVSVQEYLQLAMMYAMDNEITNVDRKVFYGGHMYMLHFCLTQVDPSPDMGKALGGSQ